MYVGKNIAVSDHAIERMKERMKIQDNKIRSVVREAWYKNINPSKEFLDSGCNRHKYGYNSTYYRKHMGFIFVFQKNYIDIVLITVFADEKYEKNTKKTFGKYSYRSILQELYTPKNEKMRRKNNPRTCYNIRRKAGK